MMPNTFPAFQASLPHHQLRSLGFILQMNGEEPDDELGSSQSLPANASLLLQWKRVTLKSMSKGIVQQAPKTKFKPANNTKVELIRRSQGMQRLITMDERLSEQDKQDSRKLTTARGAYQYLGSDHLLAYNIVGGRPGTLVATAN